MTTPHELTSVQDLTPGMWVNDKLRGYSALRDYILETPAQLAALIGQYGDCLPPGCVDAKLDDSEIRHGIYCVPWQPDGERWLTQLYRDLTRLEVIYVGQLMVAKTLGDASAIRRQVYAVAEATWQEEDTVEAGERMAIGRFDYFDPARRALILKEQRTTRFVVDVGPFTGAPQVSLEFIEPEGLLGSR